MDAVVFRRNDVVLVAVLTRPHGLGQTVVVVHRQLHALGFAEVRKLWQRVELLAVAVNDAAAEVELLLAAAEVAREEILDRAHHLLADADGVMAPEERTAAGHDRAAPGELVRFHHAETDGLIRDIHCLGRELRHGDLCFVAHFGHADAQEECAVVLKIQIGVRVLVRAETTGRVPPRGRHADADRRVGLLHGKKDLLHALFHRVERGDIGVTVYGELAVAALRAGIESVETAERERIHVELAAGLVYGAFHGEQALRRAVAAHRAGGDVVRERHNTSRIEVRDDVGAAAVADGLRHDARAEVGIRAAVAEQIVLQAENASVRGDRELFVHFKRMALVMIAQGILARERDAHGAPRDPRADAREHAEKMVALAAERAADLDLAEVHLFRVALESACAVVARAEGGLRVAVVHIAPVFERHGDRALRLDVAMLDALGAVFLVDDDRRLGERFFHVTLAEMQLQRHIAVRLRCGMARDGNAGLGVIGRDARRAGSKRLVRREYCGEDLIVDLHELGRGVCDLLRFRKHERERFGTAADTSAAEHRRVHRQRAIVKIRAVGVRDHAHHTRHGERLRGVNAQKLGTRLLRPDDLAAEHAGNIIVIHVFQAARHLADGVHHRVRAADHIVKNAFFVRPLVAAHNSGSAVNGLDDARI